MLRASTMALGSSRLTSMSPWRRKPFKLSRGGASQMVNRDWFNSPRRRHLDPDDRSVMKKASHVILKHCSMCNRMQEFDIERRHEFHTCCEGTLMKERGNLKTAQELPVRLTRHVRHWDFDLMRPKCSPRRPASKVHSKLAKK